MGEALVTGATGGIGTAVVEALLTAGHEVTTVGRDGDGDGLNQLAELGARTVATDLEQVDGLGETLGDVTELDALIHCAGISEIASVADTPSATWARTLTVNVTAAAELTRLMLPALRRSRGHVVFVNASPGMRAVPRWAAYVASKSALRELADSLRAEEAGHGVRVTTVYPAGTATELLRRVRNDFGRPYDPARCVQPATLAGMIMWVLAAPPDAYATELAVHPTPRAPTR